MKAEHIGFALAGIVFSFVLIVILNKADQLDSDRERHRLVTVTNTVFVTNIVTVTNKLRKPRTESDGDNYTTYTNFEGRVWRYKSN